MAWEYKHIRLEYHSIQKTPWELSIMEVSNLYIDFEPVNNPPKHQDTLFNSLGKDGWELGTHETHPFGADRIYHFFIFKRAI